ncbi:MULTISPECIES: PP2C family protein-serine/threonine phosphatase [Streptomyces]|uniref:SpoIIE family protein phosphatase n=1 Tax=Streptomyces koelreuteriae TaxID=2838015 RepID=A0ABX8FK46_9ACTN|nr:MULTISPECIES: SpoIIE family protein phosphatase [Streptomyces]QWB21516.1 SpoIIE family protein phosphatase [Streptomyces koelreuteriae]UUA04437.1 SpoIIE family protein phosphatase [Streptomyces koelreuteriae]UUA12062.1 SpoIIE family protein phosphatase [Streptomyces sp. CRCS-T-1]
MCRTGGVPEPAGTGDETGTDAAFTALLEDSAEDLYESAPCGYLSTLMDGTIAKINTTLLDWLGLEREAVVGRKRFTDLLTVGGKLYHETHFGPLLRMQGELRGIALDVRRQGGGRLPVLVSAVVKYGTEGEPLLIRVTVFDASDRRSYETELLRRRKEAERARAEADEARRQAEADRARLADALTVLQRSLVPDSLPAVPGLETAVHYHTAAPDQLGGDFYDLFPVAGDRWAFFLGDVCGKGPAAASLTSLTRYTLRAAAHHDPDPAAALATLNAVLHERYTAGGDPRYCTCVFGIVEPGGDHGPTVVRLASGGHPPALVLRSDGRAEFLHTRGGLLVGVVPDAPISTVETVLAAGDTIVLYTDGLTEARSGPHRDDLYGENALLAFGTDLAPAAPGEVITALTGLLDGFGDGLNDDTALLALGVPANSSLTRPARGSAS